MTTEHCYSETSADPRQETPGLLAALIETSEDAIISLTTEGRIVTFNKAAEAMFDYSRKEIIGMSAFQLVPLGRGGDLQAKLKRLRAGESIEHYETVRMKKDGTRFNVSLRISAIRSDQGELLGISWILRDITAKKNAEFLIRKLSSVVEQTADTVMITDKAGKIEYVNPAFVKTTGYSKEEALGRTSSILKSGRHSPLFYRDLWKTILSGKPFQATIINKKKNGELFYSEKTITPLLDDDGAITHFVSTDKDITDRKLAEQHSQSIQRRFTELFNYSPDAMAYCALDGTLMEVNEAFSALTGYPKEELIHRKKYQDITTPKYWGQGSETLRRVLATGQPSAYEKEYCRKDGSSIPALVNTFPVRSSDGKNIVAVGTIIKDITQIKEQQRQLEAAAFELKRSNMELERFASLASHDLQEPLRTMSTYLQWIEKRNELDEESRQYFKFVIDSSKRLSELIKDLLAFSRVGANRSSFEKFEVRRTVDEALVNLGESIAGSHAVIEVGELPEVWGDPRKTVQLFQNLIANAVKYHSTESPVVKISAERGKHGWTFKVADNGIGIAKQHTARIFEMFRRLHSNGEFVGTGVGLAICRRIVEQRGGEIWVESEVGKGSRFCFTLPDELPLPNETLRPE